MAKIMHPGLRAYAQKKLADLRADNAKLAAGGNRVTHYVLQFVVDAETDEVYCSTRYIRPGAAHIDRAACHQDLVNLFDEHYREAGEE